MDESGIFAEQGVTPTTLAQRLIALATHEPRLPDDAPVGDHGGVHQVDRLATIAEWACATGPGDLVEFGTYAGHTTVRLAAIARQYGRRVLCFDTFPATVEYALDTKVMPDFLSRIAPWPEIEFHRLDTTGRECCALVQARQFRFAFVDTMKHHEHVRAELRTVLPATHGVVAVDDAYVIDILRACEDEARRFPGWAHLRWSPLRETWMVRT